MTHFTCSSDVILSKISDQRHAPIYSRSLERKKNLQAFCLLQIFLSVGLLKSRISKKSFKPLGRKLDFKHFHYKARVQQVTKLGVGKIFILR